MVSSYQIGLPLNEIQDSYSATSVQEHLMFAASKGLSHQEKKERKERDLCWPRCLLHVATYHIHWFSKPVWLIWNVRALLDCKLEISESTVVITQAGSVSCVACHLIATSC